MDYVGLTDTDHSGHPEKGMGPAQLGPLDTQLDPCSYLALYQGIPVQTAQGIVHVPFDEAMLEGLCSSFSNVSPVTQFAHPFGVPQMEYPAQTLGLQQACLGQPSGPFEQYEETLSPTSSMGATYSQLADHNTPAAHSWEYQLPEAGPQEFVADEWAPDLVYTPYSTSGHLSSSAMSATSTEQIPRTTAPSTYNPNSRRSSVATTRPSTKPSKSNDTKASTIKSTKPSSSNKLSNKQTRKPVKQAPKNTSSTPAARIPVPRETQHLTKDALHSGPSPADTTATTNNTYNNSNAIINEPYSSDAQRARNRLATSKCRAKAKAARSRLEEDSRAATEHRESLVASVAQLKDQVLDLKSELLRHVDCGCPLIHEYMQNAARKLGEGLPGPVKMPARLPKVDLALLEEGSGDEQDDDAFA